jgi:hypothetical protein
MLNNADRPPVKDPNKEIIREGQPLFISTRGYRCRCASTPVCMKFLPVRICPLRPPYTIYDGQNVRGNLSGIFNFRCCSSAHLGGWKNTKVYRQEPNISH